MTRRSIFALAAMALVAGRAAGQDSADRGAFVMRIGADTLVIERFARTADTLVGSISVKGQPRQDYVAVLASGVTLRTFSMSVFTSDKSDAEPAQRIRVDFRHDSAIATIGGAVQRFAVPPGAGILVNNSFAIAELFTRQARASGGTADFPAWALSGGISLTVALRPVGSDTLTLALANALERLRVDPTGRILGGVIPAQHLEIIRVGGAAANSLQLGRVDYSAPAGAPYTATEVTLTGPGGITLGGSLTMPTGVAGRVPAVVTITGSGQQDRDEYIPVAGGYRPFRQVADTLGRRGIAVLRLDDRTVGMSGGKLGTSADYADDIRAAVAFLRARADIDPERIALVGHSEGGLIAPMVAATDPRLKGIVLLAGPAQTGLRIIHYQQRNAIENDSSIKVSARDSLIRGAAVSLDSIARTSPWLGFFLSYDPLATARKVRVPALVLQGGNDRQVTPEQADTLARAMRGGGNSDVTVRVFPGLNHLFVPDPSGQPSGYFTLKSARVSPEVLGVLADWLVARLKPTHR